MEETGKNNRLGKTAVTLFRILFTACLIGTLLFIFHNSSDIGAISGGKSAAVTLWLNKFMGKAGISFRFTEYLVRKLAHFGEYMLLGFWLILTLRVYTRRILSFLAWPLFFGLLTAVTDEFYQLLVPGRSGQVQDIVIDFSGVVAGLLAGLFLLLLAGALWDALRGKR